MLGLITSANRGLGLELVRLGLAQGDSILAACRNTDGEQMTELLTFKTDYPEFLEILQMDVTKEEEVKEAAEGIYAILSGRKEILPMEIPFIDYKGRPMPC